MGDQGKNPSMNGCCLFKVDDESDEQMTTVAIVYPYFPGSNVMHSESLTP